MKRAELTDIYGCLSLFCAASRVERNQISAPEQMQAELPGGRGATEVCTTASRAVWMLETSTFPGALPPRSFPPLVHGGGKVRQGAAAASPGLVPSVC